jgi:hypothetical protein
MFLLIAIVVGFAIGLATGGRPHNLLRLNLRWNGLVFLALAVQVVISSGWLPGGPTLVRSLYVLSNVVAMIWLGRNIRLRGMPCLALGAISNLVAIVANEGRMPVDGALLLRARGAAAQTTGALGQVPSNRVLVTAQTPLAWLGDRFLLARPFPFPTVFSIGDLLIGLGIAWVIAVGMRPPARVAESPSNPSLAA